MVSGRDTPKDIQDGEFGFEPDEINNFESGDLDHDTELDDQTAVKIGREIEEASTNWINSGRRARWNDSLRAFQSMHPQGSKYLSGDYRYRSTLYRPKTRAMVRRDEAATASAFFSNEEVVSITADDDDNPEHQASAEILQALLQYRLTKTIPWFLTVVGARQDCEVMGICIGKAGWEYHERFVRSELRPKMGDDGAPKWDEDKGEVGTERVNLFEVTKDQPFADLIAPENFRFEPGCDWRDPVRSSPYLIELAPVYIAEAMERMERQHGAPAEWLKVDPSALRQSSNIQDDVTRRSREAGRVPGKDNDAYKAKEFDICWTRINIVRWKGDDWYFRTLANGGMLLEKPRPLREVHLHGQRPYVVGCVVLETHKTYPSSKVELTTDLQRAANQDWNSRFDSVMLNLQPRQFVKEGAGQDINDLQRFTPGKVVMVNSGKGEPLTNVVTWDRPPPTDSASFQEQDRINLDWDDLTGAFTNSSVRSSEVSEQSATGMHLMSGEASGLTEYELRLFAETWVEPMVKLLVKLEQAYETSPTILSIAGKKAQLFQRFNVSEITDELLNHEVTTKVNVGIGATNPQLKLKNFATGAQIIGSIFGQSAAMGANFQEVGKEVFGLLGYKDGERFFQPNFDPRVNMLQQQMQKMQGQGGDGGAGDASKVQVANINAQAKIRAEEMRAQTDERNAHLDFQTQKMEEDAATQREMMKMQSEVHKLGIQHQHDAAMSSQQQALDVGMQGMQQQHDASMGQQQNVHAAGMQDVKHEHDTGMQQGQQWHDQAQQQSQQKHEVATMPPPITAGGTPSGKAGSASSRPPAGAVPTSAMPQAPSPPTVPGAGQSPQGMGSPAQASQGDHEMDRQLVMQMGQQFMQGLQALAQGMLQANQQIAQMVQQTAHEVRESNQAVAAALTRKKKVVRGQDGRVEGVE